MKTAVAAGSKAAWLDFKKSLLEAVAVNEKSNQLLLAHDSLHRGQIALLARQVGCGIPARAGFGLWGWGTLWRECGFGK